MVSCVGGILMEFCAKFLEFPMQCKRNSQWLFQHPFLGTLAYLLNKLDKECGNREFSNQESIIGYTSMQGEEVVLQ